MKFLFLSLFLLFASFAHAENRVVIKVLSYNIKGLPWPVVLDHDRYKDIGAILAKRKAAGTAPDFILLQESFVIRTHELRDTVNFPFTGRGPEASGTLVDSGLYILSQHPISARAALPYGKQTCSGFDCMSNKGIQFIRVRHPKLPFMIEIYNTHMQAHAENDKGRIAQSKIAVDFIRKHRDPNLPMIFAGDFNMKPQRKSYSFFKGLSQLINVGEVCLKNGCSMESLTSKKEIWKSSNDQHFYAAGNEQYQIRPIYVEKSFRERVNGRELSDHLGYEVHYEITWK